MSYNRNAPLSDMRGPTDEEDDDSVENGHTPIGRMMLDNFIEISTRLGYETHDNPPLPEGYAREETLPSTFARVGKRPFEAIDHGEFLILRVTHHLTEELQHQLNELGDEFSSSLYMEIGEMSLSSNRIGWYHIPHEAVHIDEIDHIVFRQKLILHQVDQVSMQRLMDAFQELLSLHTRVYLRLISAAKFCSIQVALSKLQTWIDAPPDHDPMVG